MAVFTTAALVTGLTSLGFAATTAATIVSVAATVATASMYVGFAGLGLKIIGAATGNKTLTKIGTYMGYAGLAGAVVTGMIGTSEMVDKGLFEFGNQTGKFATETYAHGASVYPGFGGPLPTGAEGSVSTPANALATAADSGTTPHVIGDNVVGHQYPSDSLTGPESLDSAPIDGQSETFKADTGRNPYWNTTPDAPPLPGVTPAPATGSPAAVGDSSSINIRDPYGNYHTPASGLMGPQQGVSPGGEQSWADWWKKVDPSVKAMGGLGLAQTGAGAAQGWFAGQSAEEKLKLETLMNEQKQTEMQRRIFNASFAPKVVKSSSTGMLNLA